MKHRKEPEATGCTSPIHQLSGMGLEILDTTLGGILVLLQRFRVGTANVVLTTQILNLLTEDLFGIVGPEGMRGTTLAKKVLKGARDSVGFLAFEREQFGQMRSGTKEELGLGATTMSGNAIIMSLNVTENGISADSLVDTVNVGSRKTGLVMAAHPKPGTRTKPLSRCLQGRLDPIRAQPVEMGTKGLIVDGLGQDGGRFVGAGGPKVAVGSHSQLWVGVKEGRVGI